MAKKPSLKTALEREPNPFRQLKIYLEHELDKPVPWTRLAELLGISPSRMRRLGCGSERPFNPITAERWRLAYFGKWKQLARYQDFIVDLASKRRVLTNPFGRVLRFYGFKWNKNKKTMEFTEREEALAFTPASTVGDMVKWMLPRVNATATKYGGELLTTTHDSFLSMLPDIPEVVASYHADMKVILEREWPEMDSMGGITIALPGKFRCRTDFTTGYNWRKGHICTTDCKADCVLVNPRGQFDYQEKAA